jgi:hypothetical protein
MTDTALAGRDARGRFQPGCSGNPAGKPKGAKNRTTLWLQAVREGEAMTAARTVIERATDGDVIAARFLTDRLEPRSRGRPLPLAFSPDAPYGESCAAVFAAFAAGTISPDEAMAAAHYIDHARGQRAAAAQEERAVADEQARRDWAASEEAERLDRLEEENEDLRAELAALKAELAARPAAATAPVAPEPDLNSACITRSAAPAAPPACRRRSAVRYWGGKRPRGVNGGGLGAG